MTANLLSCPCACDNLVIIEKLHISNFRNIQRASLDPHPQLNLISGNNGAGKTAVLEAIHCLSTGRSFRTLRSRELIHHASSSFTLTTQFKDPLTAKQHRCGLKRQRDGQVDLRLNFEQVQRLSTITRLLPVKPLTPDSHRLIQQGPEERRQFLDWGVFHVEPLFLGAWKQFKRSLSQRNQLLRNNASYQEITSWNDPLSSASNQINHLRKRHVFELSQHLNKRLQQIDSMFHVELRYKRGWSTESDLSSLLDSNLELHRRLKTTTDGPHRADLLLKTEDVNAKEFLSRGQQKLLIYLLHMAQLDVLLFHGSTTPIILCDDLSSELDDSHTRAIITQLLQLRAQLFVSGISFNDFDEASKEMFHVKHGTITNVV